MSGSQSPSHLELYILFCLSRGFTDQAKPANSIVELKKFLVLVKDKIQRIHQ